MANALCEQAGKRAILSQFMEPFMVKTEEILLVHCDSTSVTFQLQFLRNQYFTYEASTFHDTTFYSGL